MRAKEKHHAPWVETEMRTTIIRFLSVDVLATIWQLSQFCCARTIFVVRARMHYARALLHACTLATNALRVEVSRFALLPRTLG